MIVAPVYSQRASEYQIKAAFLFNFGKFLEMPRDSFESVNEPFIIGIAGNDPFGAHLDDIIKNETYMGRTMTIQRYKEVNDIKDCHILFINFPGNTREVINKVKDRNILTVSEDPDFCAIGGIIRFYTENNSIKLQINTKAAKASNLALSSKLLRIAKIYY